MKNIFTRCRLHANNAHGRQRLLRLAAVTFQPAHRNQRKHQPWQAPGTKVCQRNCYLCTLALTQLHSPSDNSRQQQLPAPVQLHGASTRATMLLTCPRQDTPAHPSCRTCLKASPCWCCAHHLHQDRCCHRRPDLLLLLPAAASACKPCRCTSTRRYYLPMPPSSPPWPSRRCCCCSCWRCCFTACPRTRTGARARP
jgi:hypothetical protein